MTINDSNNLGSTSLSTFTKDKTNISEWAAAEAARIQAEKDRVASLGNENNLDLIFHNRRVMITSKKTGKAMDTGGPGSDDVNFGKGLPTVIQWGAATNNQNQWVRLWKTDLSKPESPWVLSCDRDLVGTDNRYQKHIYGHLRIVGMQSNIATAATAKWLISAEGGYYRFKNIMWGLYLQSSQKVTSDGNGPLTVQERQDTGDGRDNQLWQITMINEQYTLQFPIAKTWLPKEFDKARVVINTVSGRKSLDLGWDPDTPTGLAYFRDNENVSTSWQVIYLEIVGNSDDSGWRMRVNVATKGEFYLTASGDKVVRGAKDVNNVDQQWHIRVTGSGLYRITTKKFDPPFCLTIVDNKDAKVTGDDAGTTLSQVFSIVKLPQELAKYPG